MAVIFVDEAKELDFASPTGFMKVKDFLPYVTKEVTDDYTGQYAILRESLQANGQLIPLHVSKDYRRLRDGIHRLAIISTLGWSAVFISDTKIPNYEWDVSEDGKLYWKLWNKRLEGFRNEN